MARVAALSLMHHRADLPHLPKGSTAMGKKGMPRDLEARLYVRCFAASIYVLGRCSVKAAGPVELGLVGGHRVGDGYIRHEISGGTAGMTIICDDVQAKAGVFRVNGADGAGVALFLNNSDLAEEGGSCPAERMMPGDVVASNHAALEVVPLSVDLLATGAAEGGVVDQREPKPPPEGYGDGRVGQGHGVANRSGFEPVASSWACTGADAGLIPKGKGAGAFLNQVVVEGLMKVFGHGGLEVLGIALPLSGENGEGSGELFTTR
eukprot:CAMPEP_0194573364 /NCGR_PEP_ID=MMETSP0292-20121207/9600_1 /TAXON_ID=39354 /ORGANISM="Heterosigma akashiwo, Strain CCMP2393" /LENGTH=263 /DNA_ID=CAMNT_0039424581 /DNA_START=194 /DNA_END=981 /DNA_ORIENTATION=+